MCVYVCVDGGGGLMCPAVGCCSSVPLPPVQLGAPMSTLLPAHPPACLPPPRPAYLLVHPPPHTHTHTCTTQAPHAPPQPPPAKPTLNPGSAPCTMCPHMHPGVLAFAGWCWAEPTANDRPILGYINFCDLLFSTTTASNKGISVATHELFHALVRGREVHV